MCIISFVLLPSVFFSHLVVPILTRSIALCSSIVFISSVVHRSVGSQSVSQSVSLSVGRRRLLWFVALSAHNNYWALLPLLAHQALFTGFDYTNSNFILNDFGEWFAWGWEQMSFFLRQNTHLGRTQTDRHNQQQSLNYACMHGDPPTTEIAKMGKYNKLENKNNNNNKGTRTSHRSGPHHFFRSLNGWLISSSSNNNNNNSKRTDYERKLFHPLG